MNSLQGQHHYTAKNLQRKLQRHSNLILDADTGGYIIPTEQKDKIIFYLITFFPDQEIQKIKTLGKQLFSIPSFACLLNEKILDLDFRKGASITHDDKKDFYTTLFHLFLSLSRQDDQDAASYKIAHHICEWILVPDDSSFFTKRVQPLLSTHTLIQFTKCLLPTVFFLLLALPQLIIVHSPDTDDSLMPMFMRSHNSLIIFLALALKDLASYRGFSVVHLQRRVTYSLLSFAAAVIYKCSHMESVPIPWSMESISFYDDFIVHILLTLTWCSDVSMVYGLPFCILSSNMISTCWQRQVLSQEMNNFKLLALDSLDTYQGTTGYWLFSHILAIPTPAHGTSRLSKNVLLHLILLHSYYNEHYADTLNSLIRASHRQLCTLLPDSIPLITTIKNYVDEMASAIRVSSAREIYSDILQDYVNLTKNYSFLNASLVKQLVYNNATFRVLSEKMHSLPLASTWSSLLTASPQVFHVSPNTSADSIALAQKWDKSITETFSDFLNMTYSHTKHLQLPTMSVLYLNSPDSSLQSKLSLFMEHLSAYPFLLQTFIQHPEQRNVYWPTCAVDQPVIYNHTLVYSAPFRDLTPVQIIWHKLYANLCVQQAEPLLSMAQQELDSLHGNFQDIFQDSNFNQLASLFIYLQVLEPSKMEPWLQLWRQTQFQMWNDMAVSIEQVCALALTSENFSLKYTSLLQQIHSFDIFENPLTLYAQLLIKKIKNHSPPISNSYLSLLTFNANVFVLQKTLQLLPDFLNPVIMDYTAANSETSPQGSKILVTKGASVFVQSALHLFKSTSKTVEPHNHYLVSEHLVDITRQYQYVLIPWTDSHFYKSHLFYFIMHMPHLSMHKKKKILKSLYKSNKTFFLSMFVQFVLHFDYHRMIVPLKQLCSFMLEISSHEQDLQNVKHFLKTHFFSFSTQEDWNSFPLSVINDFFPFF